MKLPAPLKSKQARWYLLAALWLAIVVLGVGGFLEQANQAGLNRSTVDTLYLTLQLMALDFDSGAGPLNWRLQVARFAAPVMAASTILLAATVVMRDQLERLRIRRSDRHIVVCGLGDTGERLAEAFVAAGQRVVAVEQQPSAPGVIAAKAAGALVVIGDARSAAVLKEARVGRAKDIVAVCGNDGANVEVAAAAAALERPAGRPALRCAVHIADTQLSDLLREYTLRASGHARTEFFNIFERAARSWMAEYPPWGSDEMLNAGRRPHLVVLGLGKLGRSLVVAAVRRCVDLESRPDGAGPLRLTLVDRDASSRWEALVLRHPALADHAEVTSIDIDLGLMSTVGQDQLATTLTDGRPTAVAVAFGDDGLALSSALTVHETIREPSVHVVMRTRTATGLSALASTDSAASSFPGLRLYPIVDRTCTPSALEGGLREELARAIHEDYLARTGEGQGLRRPWEELDDEEREQSRRAADHIAAHLDSIGYDVVPLRRWDDETSTFEAGEVEALARREHERWMEDRMAAGWTYGPRRDDVAKHNPALVPWEQLPEEAKRDNREAAARIPAQLVRAGFELARWRSS